jgi:hypothetical protein
MTPNEAAERRLLLSMFRIMMPERVKALSELDQAAWLIGMQELAITRAVKPDEIVINCVG